jgi:transposase InsO family protein
MKFQWIKEHCSEFPVEAMCRALSVSSSGYYASVDRPVSARAQRRAELAEKVEATHDQSRGTYGSPRVYRELVAQGEQVCENTVAKIMREKKVRACTPRRFVPATTDSKHDHPVAPNRLDRKFNQPSPDAAWCSDITYIPTRQGWLYLAVVIDLCSRRVVGWSMGDSLEATLVCDALTMALITRRPGAGAAPMHHSDRGVQYACGRFQALLAAHGLTCSMSRTGNCYDNAVAESFFSTLKRELVHRQDYATRDEARASIFEYIEVFYNRQRRHSSLGYLSPEAFEASRN